jgi:hypothetical protein
MVTAESTPKPPSQPQAAANDIIPLGQEHSGDMIPSFDHAAPKLDF